MKLKPALVTLIIGLVLYIGLPRVVPVPDAKSFKGAATPAKVVAVATPNVAAPAAAGAAKAAPEKAATETDSKLKAALEEKRRADWVRGLHLLAIFITTIIGIILKPMPMGAVAIIGIAVTAASGTLPITDALSGFSDVVIWLIVLAFFISRGFIKTGLGARIAYSFMALLGKRRRDHS
jgi:DASS family divalent anion:Na+ symporter